MGKCELLYEGKVREVYDCDDKLLLVSDRANCSPETMELIKNDIIKVIAKYMEIDSEGLDIQITQTESDGNNGSVPALIANIPIKELHHGK